MMRCISILKVFYIGILAALIPFVFAWHACASTWSDSYVISGMDFQQGAQIVGAGEGAYCVTGWVGSQSGVSDDINMLVMKVSSDYGRVMWAKQSNVNLVDAGTAIDRTSDGGYIVAGYEWPEASDGSTSGNQDWALWRIGHDGELLWHKTYDAGQAKNDFPAAIIRTNDGDYMVAGWTEPTGDAWIQRLDPYGNVEWGYIYGGSLQERPYSLISVSDGGYLMSGYTKSVSGDTSGEPSPGSPRSCMWLLKIDASGVQEWSYAYIPRDFPGQDYIYGEACLYSVVESLKGGFLACGELWFSSPDTGYDVALLELTTLGKPVENGRAYGGEGRDAAFSSVRLLDSSYAIIGETYSFAKTDGSAWLFKLDSDFNMLWQKYYDTQMGHADTAGQIIQTADDGQLMFVGSISATDRAGSEVWITKINPVTGEFAKEPMGLTVLTSNIAPRDISVDIAAGPSGSSAPGEITFDSTDEMEDVTIGVKRLVLVSSDIDEVEEPVVIDPEEAPDPASGGIVAPGEWQKKAVGGEVVDIRTPAWDDIFVRDGSIQELGGIRDDIRLQRLVNSVMADGYYLPQKIIGFAFSGNVGLMNVFRTDWLGESYAVYAFAIDGEWKKLYTHTGVSSSAEIDLDDGGIYDWYTGKNSLLSEVAIVEASFDIDPVTPSPTIRSGNDGGCSFAGAADSSILIVLMGVGLLLYTRSR